MFIIPEIVVGKSYTYDLPNLDLDPSPTNVILNERQFNYTACEIFSTQKFNTGNSIHIRFKSAKGFGMWPAFWTFGAYDGLFLCGADTENKKMYTYMNEVDGMEIFPHSSNYITSNSHFYYSSVTHPPSGLVTKTNFSDILILDFEENGPYKMEENWTEMIIQWNENDINYWIKPSHNCTTTNGLILPSNSFTLYKVMHNENGSNIYDAKYELQSSIILGLQIGGVGYPNFPNNPYGVPTDFSYPFEIDFIRVYSEININEDKTLCDYYQTPNLPSYLTGNNITLGGSISAACPFWNENHETINGINTPAWNIFPFYEDEDFNEELFGYTFPFADNTQVRAISSIKLMPGFMAQANSQFHAAIIDLNGQIQRSPISFENELENSNINFNVYPNPTNGLVYFSFNLSERLEVTVSDIYGKTLINKKNLAENYFDLSELPNGVYLINFITEKGIFSSKLILCK